MKTLSQGGGLLPFSKFSQNQSTLAVVKAPYSADEVLLSFEHHEFLSAIDLGVIKVVCLCTYEKKARQTLAILKEALTKIGKTIEWYYDQDSGVQKEVRRIIFPDVHRKLQSVA